MIAGMLQACLNGARTRSECPHLPVSPRELAEAAAAAAAAGAADVHLHPKAPDGCDSLEAAHVDAAVAAVRAAVPGVPRRLRRRGQCRPRACGTPDDASTPAMNDFAAAR
jgi:hypothetical protein